MRMLCADTPMRLKWYVQVLRAGLAEQQPKQYCSGCPQWLSTFSTVHRGHLAMMTKEVFQLRS